MPKLRKVIKTGNSLAITIPASAIKNFNISPGDVASVKINRPKTCLTYTFSGHPRQLYLLNQRQKRSHAKTNRS